MDLRQLRYFIVVAEELHFRRAAERLHMSQPPLSQQIRKLEQELGVQLLERSSRQVRLTPAGTLLLTEGRRLLAHADDVSTIIRHASQGYARNLKLAYSEVLGSSAISTLLNRLVRLHPNMELRLRWMSMVEHLRALHAEEVDVGLVRLPVDDPQLKVLPIYEEELLAVVPETSPLAEYTALRLAQLASDGLILFPSEDHPRLYAALSETLQANGVIPRFHGDTPQLRLDMVAAGLGVSLTAERLAATVHRPGVVFRRIVDPSLKLTSAVTWRRSNNSAPVRTFLEVVRQMQIAGEFETTQPK